MILKKGKGSYAKVYMVEKIDRPGVVYAMKRVKKKRLTKQKHFEHIECEKEILKITKSPFIVNLHYSFQDKESLFYVGKIPFKKNYFLFLLLEIENFFKGLLNLI